MRPTQIPLLDIGGFAKNGQVIKSWPHEPVRTSWVGCCGRSHTGIRHADKPSRAYPYGQEWNTCPWRQISPHLAIFSLPADTFMFTTQKRVVFCFLLSRIRNENTPYSLAGSRKGFFCMFCPLFSRSQNYSRTSVRKTLHLTKSF